MPTAYVTAPPEAAERLARALVEERLAACVNRVDAASVYRWEGQVHEEAEVVLLAKTTDGRYDALAARVRELHPHEVPCVERFDEAAVLDTFADWRASAVGPRGSDADPDADADEDEGEDAADAGA